MAQTTATKESGEAAGAARLEPLLAAIGRRRLASSLLLFAAGHRPFAFLFGQAVYLAEPLCDLMGLPGSRELAEVLSRPDGMDVIEARLLAAEGTAAGSESQAGRP